ncbi:MAG: stage III sporulation protein AB [Clostridiales bacterium]|jgi:stage III sporulation protein AB|nr:stage III sporulation protein AB [Clostridiales bacterium]
MMLKVMGIALVCGASALLGLYYGSLETFRANDLNEWKKALLILKSEIAFSSTPLPEAMFNISCRIKRPVDATFLTFAENLGKRPKTCLSDIWSQTLANGKGDSYLVQEDYDWLNNFGRTLGYLDKSMQLNTIDLTLAYISNQLDFLNEHSASSRKMYRSLGILGGLLISVILF